MQKSTHFAISGLVQGLQFVHLLLSDFHVISRQLFHCIVHDEK